MEHGPLTEPGTGAVPSSVSWPSGPHYFDLTGSAGAVAWVRYRIWSADWHVRTLRTVAGAEQNYDRLVGIEMALDGALNSLSGAFDAAVTLLITGAEEALEVEESQRLDVRHHSWRRARELLQRPSIGTAEDGTSNDLVWRVILDVDAAIEGERDQHPQGWLAQLRRLRNRVAHQDSLSRTHNGPGSIRVTGLGATKGEAFEYLSSACDRVNELTEQMISLAVHLGAHELTSGWERPRWQDALNQ